MEWCNNYYNSCCCFSNTEIKWHTKVFNFLVTNFTFLKRSRFRLHLWNSYFRITHRIKFKLLFPLTVSHKIDFLLFTETILLTMIPLYHDHLRVRNTNSPLVIFPQSPLSLSKSKLIWMLHLPQINRCPWL